MIGASNVNTANSNEDWETGWARQLYGRVARVYNVIRPLWSSRAAEAELDRLFAERIGPTTRVLELAPGTGINIERLFRCSPTFGAYLGIDVSATMLHRARMRARSDSRIALQVGDATDLRRLDGTFDFIVCTWLLSHLHQPERGVADALERLESGGTAAFLFFTRPEGLLVRTVVAAFVRSFRGTFVEREAVISLPHVQAVHRAGSGYATLAVFQRPQ